MLFLLLCSFLPWKAAMLNRLRRVCERKPSGRLRVPLDIHEMYTKGGKTRDELLEFLVACDFDADWAEKLECV